MVVGDCKLLYLCAAPQLTVGMSTIEPYTGSDSCNGSSATPSTPISRSPRWPPFFMVNPVALLTANTIDISILDVENHILSSRPFVHVLVICACTDGIRRVISIWCRARPSNTLASIVGSVYLGLSLLVPLPCTYFNTSDNMLPAVYLSYVVGEGDMVPCIMAAYSTTINDIINVNVMGSPTVTPGDVLAIPLHTFMSVFPKFSPDYGLIVANGSYAITASHCVQCSCGLGDLNLYGTLASLAGSCSSMQCRNNNLMLGNVTSQPTVVGCNVTSCT
ncbi:hypothetical protein Taro_035805 [Colocasia esculenta]|uniref:LysM domain-containing protein n=1 Tax=Colocasia esculenta TaxID=4460 RepID=A0A843W7R8_COLES|nr:hypothetical protein [Colocasia esculenta]